MKLNRLALYMLLFMLPVIFRAELKAWLHATADHFIAGFVGYLALALVVVLWPQIVELIPRRKQS